MAKLRSKRLAGAPLLIACFIASSALAQPAVKISVKIPDDAQPEHAEGRLLLVLGKRSSPEPRRMIGETGMDAAPLFGRDVGDARPGASYDFDDSAAAFPIDKLSSVPPGEYFAQAVLHTNRDLNLPCAPGDLYSPPLKIVFPPPIDQAIRLELTRKMPEEELPRESDQVKFIKLESPLLSKFHGRPMFLRAGVVLPRGYADEPERRYPLRVHIGGYGMRCSAAAGMMHGPFSRLRNDWNADDAPRFVMLVLDGAGPLGDPYQVNSENHGPYGDALTQELIPHVEKQFRCIGEPWARVLDGGSTGGWVSLALQVFYPDYFNGCWAGFPDGLDFRAFQLIDIYEHANAYVNEFGFERPSKRTRDGDVEFTVRHECRMENVLGRGDSWTLSGQQWGAWNATYGPRGPDGRPVPLWNARTGVIDKSVLEHWKKYDLRRVLETQWPTIGRKLRGKIHIWVGDADEYFLDKGVRLMERFLETASPPYGGWVRYGSRQGHGWSPLSEKALLEEMNVQIEKTCVEGPF
jgi:Putative esterase